MMNESRVIGLIKALGENGTGGGGGGVFIVHGETADMQSITISTPFKEAWAAFEAGKHVVLHMATSIEGEVARYSLPCVIAISSGDDNYTMNYGVYVNGISILVADQLSWTGERYTDITIQEMS
jgi:hypothetical protein